MLILDTGVLVASADRSDRHHDSSAALVRADPGPLVTTALVIAEAAYLVRRQLGSLAEVGIYAAIASGDLLVESLGAADWERIRDLVEQYADLPLGGTDASLVAIAERLDARRIATIDDHFRVVRPRHCDTFELLPS